MGSTADLLSYVTARDGTAKSGLTVELWEAGGGAATASTSTDANGKWSFAGQDDSKDIFHCDIPSAWCLLKATPIGQTILIHNDGICSFIIYILLSYVKYLLIYYRIL